MSELLALQKEFAAHAALLVLRINGTEGCACVLGEAKRSDEQAEINAIGEQGRAEVASLIRAKYPGLAEKIVNNGKAFGIRNSAHGNKLAIDLDLFINGIYRGDNDAHKQFGDWWKLQHPLARWGGDFKDGNHYSLEFNGVK